MSVYEWIKSSLTDIEKALVELKYGSCTEPDAHIILDLDLNGQKIKLFIKKV